MESRTARLKRFKDGPPEESISTLLNSIANFFNNEIQPTPQHLQSTLLFLGIHAAALTIAELVLGESNPRRGYKAFLETFVDGSTPDTKFSSIASELHNWRNVLAHQWIGSIGHQIGYDYDMENGWEKRAGVTFVNPRIYCKHYLDAFGADGRIWDYESLLTEEQLEEAKSRIVAKYESR